MGSAKYCCPVQTGRAAGSGARARGEGAQEARHPREVRGARPHVARRIRPVRPGPWSRRAPEDAGANEWCEVDNNIIRINISKSQSLAKKKH